MIATLKTVTEKQLITFQPEISGYNDFTSPCNSCLIIDCRKSGPPKHTTKAEDKFEQFCFYGKTKKISCTLNF